MRRREEHERFVRGQRLFAVVRGFILGVALLLGGLLFDLHIGFLVTGAVTLVLSGAGWAYLKSQQRR